MVSTITRELRETVSRRMNPISIKEMISANPLRDPWPGEETRMIAMTAWRERMVAVL